MRKPCERLSRRQRAATPEAFARWLVERVRMATGSKTVAILWVQAGTVYTRIAGLDLWGEWRDARKYAGPYPIIAHPPCGPWGKFKWRCTQSKDDGIMAMALVHRWRGVVEQPVGSSLFRQWQGFPAGQIERVEQGRWGHPSPKPTLLYWVT